MNTKTKNHEFHHFSKSEDVSYEQILRNRQKYPPNYSRNYAAEARVWWLSFAAGVVGFLLCGFPAVGSAIEIVSNPHLFSKLDYLIPIGCGSLSVASLYFGITTPIKLHKAKTKALANR